MAKMPFKNCHFNGLRQNGLKNFRVKTTLLFGFFSVFVVILLGNIFSFVWFLIFVSHETFLLFLMFHVKRNGLK